MVLQYYKSLVLKILLLDLLSKVDCYCAIGGDMIPMRVYNIHIQMYIQYNTQKQILVI
jgi:hypothetical protein